VSAPASTPHITIKLRNRSSKSIAGFVLGVDFLRRTGNFDRVFEYTSVGRTGVSRQDVVLGPDAVSEISIAVPTGRDGQPVGHRTRVEYIIFADGTRWDTSTPQLRTIPVNDSSRLQKALHERGEHGLTEELYHPAFELWSNLRRELEGKNGAAYFSESIEGAELPEFLGTVRSQEGSNLVLSISDPVSPEVTLHFDAPMESLIQSGAKVTFKGVARQFTANPFMLYFDVRRADVSMIRE
jgi:hypothetical protein